MATINDHDAIVSLAGFKAICETARSTAQGAIDRFGGDAENAGAGRVRDMASRGLDHIAMLERAFSIAPVTPAPFETQAQAQPNQGPGRETRAQVADLLNQAARILQQG